VGIFLQRAFLFALQLEVSIEPAPHQRETADHDNGAGVKSHGVVRGRRGEFRPGGKTRLFESPD